MFGPTVKVFRGSRLAIAALAVLAAVVILIAAATAGETGPSERVWIYAPAALVLSLLGLLFFWIRSIRITLFQDGFTYESLFGSCSMRWTDVERIYYEAIRQSVNFIPVGTSRTIKIEQRSGQKLKIGNRIENSEQLASDLVGMTHEHIFARAAQTYNSGGEVDFGNVRLSSSAGLKLKGLFGYRVVSLGNVHSYRLEKGYFHVWKRPGHLARSVSIGRIANVFVLTSILDSLYQPS